ncbi:LysR family transcriptional regulator [Pantoea sp. GM01]|uniref:LysR family transcriptional regulator n=1 Tax=Pantoea sp. GM01 TaxID=1144320 RepID=UPI000270F7EF|nr:LysR family transcriptional regulator [Pantoea sp. GM01]EJL93211.1 transcriptional regulator [Pantoea sp. GM01]
MLDGLSLDQIRTFVAAAENRSFSAAGRQLGRAQSVVSHTLATMEMRLGVRLFDRTGRYPVITSAGLALLSPAKNILAEVDIFKGRAKSMSQGVEAEIVVVLDVMVPLQSVTGALREFEKIYPDTRLSLSIETLGAALHPVIAGSAVFAITGPLSKEYPELVSEAFAGIPMAACVSPSHPLAALASNLTLEQLAEHRQIVLSERSTISHGRDFGVISSMTWNVSDLNAKRILLKEGLGWGAMPLEYVENDVASGDLVELNISNVSLDWAVMPMFVVWHPARPPGKAARWLLEKLCS